MPHGFEYIVRPYQSPGSFGIGRIPATPKGTRERAHLVWGGKGTMPSYKTLYPSTKVNTKKETLDETDRESEVIRIFGNDPENWVDVARAKMVRLDKKVEDKGLTTASTAYANTDPKLDPRLTAANFSTKYQDPVNPEPEESKVIWNMKNQ